ncbi:MAG: hypothetical protein V7698_04230 [Paracoccaceae bacterium]|jgi:hypothetical protein|uniref:hypothetical protein n=1 Tax=unclassified Seohaeicola TaxID=2641111 RepID=UPI00237C15A6|nr:MULTISPECIES: hypothetical protein [unclassified Seohaeicola]MDD9707746.1 hypothetical protein [Seohaeicola sp. 4SK31]MDD9735988.1 hypothetical protein [Seohaeicola sp. SP36]
MVRCAVTLSRLAGIATLAAALIMIGFGHRAPAQSDVAVQAYVLAGGSLAELCADPLDDSLPAHMDCPACHLVATCAGGTQPDLLRDADLRMLSRVVAPQENRAARMVLDPALGLRAPPLA